MQDWIGLIFFALLMVGAIVGLKILAKPTKRTEEEFERGAAESVSMLGASMNALQELMNPAEAKAKEVQTELKEGRYNKREGKANGTDETNENDTDLNNK